MCIDDEAQLVLFTALDVIECAHILQTSPRRSSTNFKLISDTKMTSKSLVSSVISAAPTLTTTPQGRRALFHLLVPRTRRHFTPAQIVNLSETDEVRGRTSKKDSEIREEEVRKAASEGLLEFVVNEGKTVSRETGGSLVVAEIMLYADGGKSIYINLDLVFLLMVLDFIFASHLSDKTAAMNALLQPLTTTYPSEDPTAPHPIDLPHTSRLYKTLLQGGHFSHTTHTVTRSPSFSPSAFASAFISIVGKNSTVAMAGGDGAFLVAELIERVSEEGSGEEKALVKGWFGKSVQDTLESEEKKGRAILLGKIAKLSLS